MTKLFSMMLVVIMGVSISCTTVPITAPSQASVQISEQIVKPRWEELLFNTPIEYENPQKYLDVGALTALSSENRAKVEAKMKSKVASAKDWETVLAIYTYMNTDFTNSAAGGVLIAKRTTDQMFADKTLTGCHDWGIVLASCLRSFGIPAVIVDAAEVSWAKRTVAGERGGFVGHVFVEAWVEGRWVLLNSTMSRAIESYDRKPFIAALGKLFYVMFKGLDPLDYGITSNDDIQAAMLKAAPVVANATGNPQVQFQDISDIVKGN